MSLQATTMYAITYVGCRIVELGMVELETMWKARYRPTENI